ncbi:MAG: glycoside hydrolase family 127 protein [Planctomycetes bacterium]|nr:glycoside hydrolase family 127 protein [Planctomycetota bacterium]
MIEPVYLSRLLAFCCCAAAAIGQEASPALQPVPFARVRVGDPFFAPRRATNTAVTLDHALRQLEEVGTLGNYDLAAKGATTGYRGPIYQDSDAYKALEAVAYTLGEYRDPALEARFDAVVARMAAAQDESGYLDTAYQVQQPGPRWSNLRDHHELYCAGHLFEAAVAHFQATGKRTLLDVATRFADLIVREFGPDGPHAKGYPGHPEIELALVKLARATDNDAYLALAQQFVRRRGSGWFAVEHDLDPRTTRLDYWLDHVPVAAMQDIAGHAVRAAYLMAGATDVAAATDDAEMLAAVQRIWRNTIAKNVFVTGGIGPSAHNEGFTVDYDLPTFSAYQESCASIALVLWAHRLNLVTRDPGYADAVERALYNAIPAGVQLDGTRFFYTNPLASDGDHHRRDWFGCACCPPNLARTFAAVGGYAYATSDDTLFVNLYLAGDTEFEIGGGRLGFVVETEYPWNGKVALRIVNGPPRELAIRLRVPGWCEGASVKGPADTAPRPVEPGYAEVRGTFRRGDRVELELPMPVRRLIADPRAEALRGRVAFARGPIVYCAEQVDQQAPVAELIAAPGRELTGEWRADLLGGVTVLRGELLHAPVRPWSGNELYRSAPAAVATPVTLVPYAVWDNRAAGAMAVWLPTAAPPPRIVGPEASAAIELSFRHTNCFPEGLRDGFVPQRSGDTPRENAHFWPHEGGTEWAAYRWQQPQRLAGCRVFWFDDTGHGGCRLPAAARLYWLDGESWRPVEPVDGDGLPLAIDRWCEIRFAPVTTTALKLEVEQQAGFSSGILEWQVVGAD